MVKKILFITFLFLSSVGFSQEKSISKLSASPNPFINTTAIVFNSTKKQSITLCVKSVLGKTVFKQTFVINDGNNKISFHKNNLHKGMYIYTIRNNKEAISKRLVIR